MVIQFVTVAHVFICIVLVLIVLVQQGRGADMGAAFGGGSNTLFGASGADTLLTKITTTAAVLFMITSLTLAANATRKADVSEGGRLFQDLPAAAAAKQAASSAAPSQSAPAQNAAAPAPAVPEQKSASPEAAK